MTFSLGRRSVAEFLGTAFLVAAVVGSGIMGDRLSDGNAGLALLANTMATGAALVALLLTFGPISGAHLNPIVSIAQALMGTMAWSDVSFYVFAQFTGGIFGTLCANLMFGLQPFALSRHVRSGPPQWFSELVATFGLIVVIFACAQFESKSVPAAVACYITAAYWFTASTSFANPAVTVARSLSDTFAGIRPVDVLPFVAAQVLGGSAGILVFGWLSPRSRDV